MQAILPVLILAAVAVCPLPAARADEPKPPSVIFCTADWCPACQTMKPIVKRVQAQYPIRVIDWDTDQAMCKRLGVRLLPTFLRIHRGREADRAVGVISEKRLREMCKGASQ